MIHRDLALFTHTIRTITALTCFCFRSCLSALSALSALSLSRSCSLLFPFHCDVLLVLMWCVIRRDPRCLHTPFELALLSLAYVLVAVSPLSRSLARTVCYFLFTVLCCWLDCYVLFTALMCCSCTSLELALFSLGFRFCHTLTFLSLSFDLSTVSF